LHRIVLEVLALESSTSSGGPVRVVSYGIEAIGSSLAVAALHRVSLEVLAREASTSSGGPVRVVAYGIEFIAPKPPRITARAVPSPYEVVAHNWLTELRMRTSWLTDVRQAGTVAEERVSLRPKPVRQLSLVLTVLNPELFTRLLDLLRRLTRELYAIPLFQDVTVLTQDAIAGSTMLFGDFVDRRIYAGQNILLAELGGDGGLTGEFTTAQALAKFSSQLSLITGTARDVFAGRWVVFPLMDVQRVFENKIELSTGQIGQVEVTFDESVGPSTLPPLQTGNPDGFPLGHDGAPIMILEPNWSDAPELGTLREGEQEQSGVGSIDAPRGDRRRHSDTRAFSGNRTEFFCLLRFFDSRRGRAAKFWLIDLEETWIVIGVSTNFIDVQPVGNFPAFADELSGGFVGIMFNVGIVPEAITRAVTNVTQVGQVWRITVSTVLPAISLSNIRRAARAREMRHAKDELEEQWLNTDLCTASFESIEVLREAEVIT